MTRLKVILSVAMVLGMCGIAAACPNCKDQIGGNDTVGGTAVAGAFNTSIFLMLGAFFAVVGLVVRVIVKGIRES